MKNKFTRKVRKNKRSTQRRKNRSYKRMKGGMYEFKKRLVFVKKLIPVEVKQIISSNNLYRNIDKDSTGVISFFLKRYKILLDNTQLEKTIHTGQSWRPKNEPEKIIKEIQTAITEFTSKTDEEPLASLPVSTTPLDLIIGNLKENKFLPTVEEIVPLIRSFKEQKDKEHRKPFKFNGLALALAIMNISDDNQLTRPPPKPPSLSSPPPPSSLSSSPDTTGILQKYIFVFNPNQSTSWERLEHSILPNQFGDNRQFIRMCRDPLNSSKYPFGEQPQDRQTATYDTYHILDVTQLPPKVSEKCRIGDALISQKLSPTDSNKTITITYDNRPREGEYKCYKIQKRTEKIDFTSNFRKSTDCTNNIYIPADIITVFEYDEDDIINCVYILFRHESVVINDETKHCYPAPAGSQSKVVYDKVIGSMEQILKSGLNPSVKDINKIGELEPLIDLTKDINSDASVEVAADVPKRFKLVWVSTGKWDIFQATPFEQVAFNRVNQYLNVKLTRYDMLQIKKFLVKNNTVQGENTVIVEVKEMNVDRSVDRSTLKRAICMGGEPLSEYELLDTIESAVAEKQKKERHYSLFTAQGPFP